MSNIVKAAAAFVLAAAAISSPAFAEPLDLSGNPDTFFTDDPAFKKAMTCPRSTTTPFIDILDLRLKAKMGDSLGALAEILNKKNPDREPLPLPPDTAIFQLAANGILPSAHAETLSYKRVYNSMNGFRPSAEETHSYFCKAVEEKAAAVLKAFKNPTP